VVFTQANREGTLRERLNRLYDDLAELTKPRSQFRTKYILGGVWRLHVGHKAEDGDWNLHFDSLWETREMPAFAIEREWRRISGSSAEVEQVRRHALSFRDISKYVMKVPFYDFRVKDVESAQRNAGLLEEYADAIGRRRKIVYTGTWRRRPRKRG
jgi:hypothetical protein